MVDIEKEYRQEDYIIRFVVFFLLFAQMYAANEMWRIHHDYGYVTLLYVAIGTVLPGLILYFSAGGVQTPFMQDALDICAFNVMFKYALAASHFIPGDITKSVFNSLAPHVSWFNWTLFALMGLRIVWLGWCNWPVFGVIGVARKFGIFAAETAKPKHWHIAVGYLLVFSAPLIGAKIDAIPSRKGVAVYAFLALIVAFAFLVLRALKRARAARALARKKAIDDHAALQASHAQDRANLKTRAQDAEMRCDMLAGELHARQFESAQAGVVSIRLDGSGTPLI